MLVGFGSLVLHQRYILFTMCVCAWFARSRSHLISPAFFVCLTNDFFIEKNIATLCSAHSIFFWAFRSNNGCHEHYILTFWFRTSRKGSSSSNNAVFTTNTSIGTTKVKRNENRLCMYFWILCLAKSVHTEHITQHNITAEMRVDRNKRRNKRPKRKRNESNGRKKTNIYDNDDDVDVGDDNVNNELGELAFLSLSLFSATLVCWICLYTLTSLIFFVPFSPYYRIVGSIFRVLVPTTRRNGQKLKWKRSDGGNGEKRSKSGCSTKRKRKQQHKWNSKPAHLAPEKWNVTCVPKKNNNILKTNLNYIKAIDIAKNVQSNRQTVLLYCVYVPQETALRFECLCIHVAKVHYTLYVCAKVRTLF